MKKWWSLLLFHAVVVSFARAKLPPGDSNGRVADRRRSLNLDSGPHTSSSSSSSEDSSLEDSSLEDSSSSYNSMGSSKKDKKKGELIARRHSTGSLRQSNTEERVSTHTPPHVARRHSTGEKTKEVYNLASLPQINFAGYEKADFDDYNCVVKFTFSPDDADYLTKRILSGYVDTTTRTIELRVKEDAEYVDQVIYSVYRDQFAENCGIRHGGSVVKKSTDSDNNLTIKFPYGPAIGVPLNLLSNGMQWKDDNCLAVFRIPHSTVDYWEKMRSKENLFGQADEHGKIQLMFKGPDGELTKFNWGCSEERHERCRYNEEVEPLKIVTEDSADYQHIEGPPLKIREGSSDYFIELVVGKLIGKGEQMAPIIETSENSEQLNAAPKCEGLVVRNGECLIVYEIDPAFPHYWHFLWASRALRAETNAQGSIQLVLKMHGRSNYYPCEYKNHPKANMCVFGSKGNEVVRPFLLQSKLQNVKIVVGKRVPKAKKPIATGKL